MSENNRKLKYPDALNGYMPDGSKLIDIPELYLSSEDYDRIRKAVVDDVLEAAKQDKKDAFDKALEGSKEYLKEQGFINKSETHPMAVMAVPNPNAYVFRGKQGKEAIAEAKYITIGTEDGWLECKNNKVHEEYLQAKAITEEYEFVKAIKLEAYREFAKELNEKIDFYRRNYDLDYGMLIDFFENDISEIVKFKEGELE